MPARRQRPCFRLAVADDTDNDKAWVIKGRSVGMRKSIAEFAALVNRTGRLRRHMAWNTARERELGEQSLHARFIGRNVRINLTVGPLEVGVGNQAGPPLAGARDVDHLAVLF